jgi:hypothetical protein
VVAVVAVSALPVKVEQKAEPKVKALLKRWRSQLANSS